MFPVTGKNLTPFIPQKTPFVFITALEKVTESSCTTVFDFSADHQLCEGGKLSAAGLMENMAQSAGCKIGYEDFLQGKKHSVAFIGEVRDFIFTRLPNSGEELRTEITIENKVFGTVTVMNGKIKVNDEEIASCKMKVFFRPQE